MTRRRGSTPGWASLLPGVALLSVLSLLISPVAQAAPPPAARVAEGDDFAYIAQPGDTLIGLGRRLLREPNRWPGVQQRNQIANPYRIRPGSILHIPYSWLKVSAETAAVTKVAGAVTTNGKPLTTGQSLSQGALVETGPDGSVAIDLADGSRIILQKSSSLRLSEMQRVDGVPNAHDIQIQLPDGHADTLVKPHRDVGRFEIITPTASLGVRGTIFRTNMLAAEGVVTTETLEGVVAVSASGETVDTRADFGTRVEKGAAPLKPVPLLPAPVLSTGTNVQRQLHFEFAPVGGAKSYHIQVSDNPEFQTFVADTTSEQPVVDLPAPPDGTYWLRVRGVDSLGLEGHDAVQPFNQQLKLSPPPPPPPQPQLIKISRHALHFQWEAQPGQQYRAQIARDPQFHHILTDQTRSEGSLDWRRPWPGRYYIRVEPLPTADGTAEASALPPPADGTAEGTALPPPADRFAQGTPFDVPVPLWVRIAAPIVILTPLLF